MFRGPCSMYHNGPYPMHEVVLMAVSAAVRTDITSWITDFQKSLFFIFLLRFMFFHQFCRYSAQLMQASLCPRCSRKSQFSILNSQLNLHIAATTVGHQLCCPHIHSAAPGALQPPEAPRSIQKKKEAGLVRVNRQFYSGKRNNATFTKIDQAKDRQQIISNCLYIYIYHIIYNISFWVTIKRVKIEKCKCCVVALLRSVFSQKRLTLFEIGFILK